MKLWILGKNLYWIRGKRNYLTKLYTKKSKDVWQGGNHVARMTNEPALVSNYNIMPLKVVYEKASSCIFFYVIESVVRPMAIILRF